MSGKINVAEIIKEVKSSDFVLNCKIPMGYSTGLPVLSIVNDTLCMKIPFLKYKVTGIVDKTLVFPIRYTVTVSLPNKRVLGFEDLSINPLFGRVDFEKPIGFFRHDSIKQYNKAEYKQKRAELIEEYNKIVSAILYGSDYTEDDEQRFVELFNIILEPSLKEIYKALDADFSNRYIK